MDLSNFIEKNEIYNRYRKYFDLNVELMKLSNILVEKINEKELKDIELSNFQHVVSLITSKAMRLFASIHLLTNEGYATEAAILLRALLEGIIDLKFIDKDRENRAALFIDHNWKELKDMHNIMKKYCPKEITENFLENEKEILSAYCKVKDSFVGRGWCGKSIEQRAREIGFQEAYDIVYRYLSNLLHTSFRGMRLNVRKHGDNKVFDIGANELLLTTVLASAYGYYGLILDYFSQAFNLDEEEKMRELIRKAGELN